MLNLRFITATRDALETFKATSPLVSSLQRVSQTCQVQLHVLDNNAEPLAHWYNRAIDEASDDDVLVFIHDDVWIDDWFISSRLAEALAVYDVVGVAGNTRRLPQQEGWFIQPASRAQDAAFIVGGIVHGEPLSKKVSFFGDAPHAVRLLDGVFIAARAGTLKRAGVQFDPQFAFHFYDTDFCRSCEQRGLRLGVWPIALTHQSAGVWQTQAWNDAFAAYLKKWGD